MKSRKSLKFLIIVNIEHFNIETIKEIPFKKVQ